MNLKITVENTDVTADVKSECAMWKKVKELFKEYPTARILVNDENGKAYKDLTQVAKSNGKFWMVNAVKETNRKPKAKKVAENAKPVQETHTTEEADDDYEDPIVNSFGSMQGYMNACV